MISSTAMAYVRYALTIVLVTATAVYQAYPHWVWLPIVISVLGTLGIHVIPTNDQIPATVIQPVNPYKGE